MNAQSSLELLQHALRAAYGLLTTYAKAKKHYALPVVSRVRCGTEITSAS